MKPLALDTPLHVEQRWIAGLRAREARLQADALDLAYLRHWAMALGVGTLLQGVWMRQVCRMSKSEVSHASC